MAHSHSHTPMYTCSQSFGFYVSLAVSWYLFHWNVCMYIWVAVLYWSVRWVCFDRCFFFCLLGMIAERELEDQTDIWVCVCVRVQAIRCATDLCTVCYYGSSTTGKIHTVLSFIPCRKHKHMHHLVASLFRASCNQMLGVCLTFFHIVAIRVCECLCASIASFSFSFEKAVIKTPKHSHLTSLSSFVAANVGSFGIERSSAVGVLSSLFAFPPYSLLSSFVRWFQKVTGCICIHRQESVWEIEREGETSFFFFMHIVHVTDCTSNTRSQNSTNNKLLPPLMHWSFLSFHIPISSLCSCGT